MLGWLTPVSHHLYKGAIPENLLKHSERAQISAHSHSSNLLVKWCGSDGCDKYHRQLLGRVPRKPTVVYFFVSTWISSETIYSYCATVYIHTNACAGIYLPCCSSCIHNRCLSKQYTCSKNVSNIHDFWSAISFERIVRTSLIFFHRMLS